MTPRKVGKQTTLSAVTTYVYYHALQQHGHVSDGESAARWKLMQGAHGNKMPRLSHLVLRCNERHSVGGKELERPPQTAIKHRLRDVQSSFVHIISFVPHNDRCESCY